MAGREGGREGGSRQRLSSFLSQWMGGCARGRGHGEEDEEAGAAATGGHTEAPDISDCEGHADARGGGEEVGGGFGLPDQL